MPPAALPRLILRYNQHLRMLRLWRRERSNAQQLLPILETLLVAIRRYQARQLLLNLQALPPLVQEVQVWLQTGWLPRLRNSGIQRLAVLLPLDVYNRMVVEGLLLASMHQTLPYEIQYFTEVAAALEWLSEAETPTTDHDWTGSRRAPMLVRCYQRRHRRRAGS
ncbi:hypothetical protein [Hymenobacter metallilatus]|uniref:STAS/SEC14 domain-containing protein n=1 Tax=Hymenobacter metallilatus TaxID=2493666 RepID=A0A3R9MCU7_9BACT|nr:hypothetical protein [Hymenobacter metallilatus]RSK37300.1 hypothetical protein EI290_01195 [Hymenobacter metallilatus]